MLLTKKLSVGYKTPLVNHLDIQIKSGELWALIGRNGSGKTTLLQTLAGFQKPLDGDIFINGNDLKKLNQKQLAYHISIVNTHRVTLPYFKVIEVLKLGRQPHTNTFGKFTADDESIVTKVINELALAPLLEKSMNQLSDGERQQVMIGRALVQDTPLLFLDEPTAHLDLVNRYRIFNILKKINKAVLVATHELELALQIADKILLLDSQGNTYQGTPQELIHQKVIETVFGQGFLEFDASKGMFFLKKENI